MDRAIVVGAGILGVMHARALLDAGLAVTHLEADLAPRGASVRNFGLVWVSGRRSGHELSAARRARELWELIGQEAPGVGFRPEGSLTVALDPAEAKVMQDYATLDDATARGTTYVDPDALRRINPAIRGDPLGALWCERDAIVEPRSAIHAIRAALGTRSGYRFVGGRRLVTLDPLTDHLGERWDADLVVVAPGADFTGVCAPHLSDAPLRRVRLQMLQTAPHPERLTTSIADADSMRYYPAYESAGLDVLPPQSDLARRHHMQLLVVQRGDGGLTIGDTHAYDEPFDFDLDEAPTLELLDRAQRILGTPLPAVQRRWAGVYAQCLDGALCWRAQIAPRIWVVTAPGGRGMTCSPAIAEESLTEIGLE